MSTPSTQKDRLERFLALHARVRALEAAAATREAAALGSAHARLQTVERAIADAASGSHRVSHMLKELSNDEGGATPLRSLERAAFIESPGAQAQVLAAAAPLLDQLEADLGRVQALAGRVNTSQLRGSASMVGELSSHTAPAVARMLRDAGAAMAAADSLAVAQGRLADTASRKIGAWEATILEADARGRKGED